MKSLRNLIYVHGTNGSGKSTLARYLIMCAGGNYATARLPEPDGPKYTVTRTRLALVGKYSTPTGGADGVNPYAEVPKLAIELLKIDHDVFIEGLMTPGVETCCKLHDSAVKLGASVRFIRLDIGFYQACKNVERRRKLTGNIKPFDPSNLRKKQNSCDGWFENLAAAGLPIYGFDFNQALKYCMSTFKLSTNGATHILDL